MEKTEPTTLLVGKVVPDVEIDACDIFDAPEEMEDILESLGGIALQREQPRLPRRHRRDARDSVQLALLRYRHHAQRALRQHEIDALLVDQFDCEVGGPVRVTLVVARDQLHLVVLAAHGNAAGGRLAESGR